MLIVGLTGGIATGKSTVGSIFAELGAYRIDTDQLARIAVEPGLPAWEAIIHYFGKEILENGGTLDRKKLGAIVFADPLKREALNNMTHPPVRALLREELVRAREKGAAVALVEVPLLYETGFERDVDTVIVVSTSEETQIERLMMRDDMSKSEALMRIKAQMPLSEKVARADFVITNNTDLEMLRQQVKEIWQQLRQECTND